ncbi:MAG: preprotein translocase subunit SecA [Phycisphaerae bacterium]
MLSLLNAGDVDILRDATNPSAVFWDRAGKAPARVAIMIALTVLFGVSIAALVLGPEGLGFALASREKVAIVVSVVGVIWATYVGMTFFRFLPGRNDRIVIALRNFVRGEIDPLDEQLRALSDEQLKEKTAAFKQRFADGESLDSIRPEAYAVVREASRRARNHRQFECQMIGSRVLERANVAEMRTGEGKTIVCYAANYMKVIQGLKVHMVTVNDYLVRRDAEFCRPIFEMLGVSVGFISSQMESYGEGARERQTNYACDITYGTNSEFGFDYLRDNMKMRASDQVQGKRHFAVIDEVDSILIDEARTPLIISGHAEDDIRHYQMADGVSRNLIRKQEDAVKQMKGRIAELEANPPSHLKGEPKFKSGIDKFKTDPLWLSSDEAEMIGLTQFFVVELDRKAAHMTEHGAKAAQIELGIGSFYDARNMNWPHYIDNSLRAHLCYTLDKDYVIQEDTIVIVDEFTGRLMVGRQWSDGLHQAVEAKERVTIKKQTQTLASITLQNFFKLYKELAGMTGTAMTEADEFMKIYKLEVVAIPTNKPIRRNDYNDKLFNTVASKYEAIVDEISSYSGKGYPADPWSLYDELRVARKILKNMKPDGWEAQVRLIDDAVKTFNDGEGSPDKLEPAYLSVVGERTAGRPLLVGTTSVENSEKISRVLTTKYGIDHEVLNAKNHAREAEIVKKGGQQHENQRGKFKNIVGNVTIATNMAGRGTDIVLGPGVAEIGGLHVVGTERHESRRIDNQLRGRCGRQGDPGSSRFFLSFEDDLLRLFMGEWVINVLKTHVMQDGVPIEHKSLTRGIENAQKKVEERNFGIRKNLLEYDEVPAQQRATFYDMRQRVLEGRQMSEFIWEFIDETVSDACARYYDPQFSAICVVEWVSQHLGVGIDPAKIDTVEIALVREGIKELAGGEIRGHVQRTFGEYIDTEAQPDEWDLNGLKGWVAQYGMSLTERRIKDTHPDDLLDEITDAALKKLGEIDLDAVAPYIAKDYGRQRLCTWSEDKFGLKIDPKDVAQATREDAERVIGDKMREVYRKREIEYPVGAVIQYATQKFGNNHLGIAEQLAKWVNLKFRLDWTYQNFEGKTLQQIFSELAAINADYMKNDRLSHEIDAAIREHQGAALVEWARKRFGIAVIDGNPIDLDRDLTEQLRRCGREMLRFELTQLERTVLLQTFDAVWKDHMYAMDLLRSGIGLRGYAEKDPKIEFKREGTRLFNELLASIRERVTDLIFKVQIPLSAPPDASQSNGNPSADDTPPPPRMQATKMDATNAGFASASGEKGGAKNGEDGKDATPEPIPTFKRDQPRVGRNDPCPCGSGKKYKQCHGKGAA